MAYPDLELKGRRGFLLLAPPAFHPSAILLLFLPKTKGGPTPRTPPLNLLLIFYLNLNFRPCTGGLNAKISKELFCAIFTSLCFFTAKNYRNSKKCNNRIVKLFRKKRLGRGVCLSQVTRSLRHSTHLASPLGSCSKFEMLQMLIHLMPNSLSMFVLVCWLMDNFMFGE